MILMEKNGMYVFKNEKNSTNVCFVDENFPIDAVNSLIRNGDLECREANNEEKEFCCWVYDNLNKPVAELEGIHSWREMKKQQLS